MSSRHTLAALIQAFFLEFLVARRGLSSNTLTAYRDGIKLLLNFTAEQRNIPVDKLAVEDFDDRTVVDFLAYLQSARGNTTRSRNTRLAPIHGLFRYIAGQVPEAMARCQQICAVPLKKAAHRSMEYLEDAEMGAMLGSIQLNSRHGLRDHTLVLFMYNTGARVQEVVDLKLDDLRLDTPPQAKLFGKGGRQRACPLWAETVQALRRYIDRREPSEKACRHVFLNANGQPFTRFGIRYLVRQYTAKAARRCPSLKGKNVGPHTIRHYVSFLTMSGDVGYGPTHIGKFGSQRGGGERIANIVLATLQALEEPEELIAWVITGRSAIGRYGSRKRLLLHLQRRLQIDLRGLHRLMAEPQRNHRTIHARFEKVHGHGVSQAVNGHALVLQRWAHLGGGQTMLVQQVLHAVDGETCAFGAGEQYVPMPWWRFTEPGFHHGACRSGKGCAAFLAPLADDAYVSPAAEDDVRAGEPGHLGNAQTRLDGHEEKGVIASAKPGALIRSGQQGIDFHAREKLDQGPRETLAGNG